LIIREFGAAHVKFIRPDPPRQGAGVVVQGCFARRSATTATAASDLIGSAIPT